MSRKSSPGVPLNKGVRKPFTFLMGLDENWSREGVFSGVACIPCFCGVLDGRMAGEEQTTSSSFPEYPLTGLRAMQSYLPERKVFVARKRYSTFPDFRLDLADSVKTDLIDC